MPANEASWDDLLMVFGSRGDPARCQCQFNKVPLREWRSIPMEEREFRLREQTDCGHPESETTTGLVAYLGDDPVGWCNVEPRSVFVRLRNSPVLWSGRQENPHDDGVWAVTCFVTRVGFRRRGVSRALAAATVDFAKTRGARALEGYPMMTHAGVEITWGELRVGSRSIFAAAGFREVTSPTTRRFVMRIDFD